MDSNWLRLQRHLKRSSSALVIALMLTLSARAGQAASFTPLVDTTRGDAPFTGMLSGDGSTIAGARRSDSGDLEPFIWDAENGIRALSGFVGAGSVKRISSDGSTLVGFSSNPDTSKDKIFTWNARYGTRFVGLLPEIPSTGSFTDVSLDGSTLVGGFTPPFRSRRASFIWDAETGFQPVSSFIGASLNDQPRLSEDGSRLVAGPSFPPFPHSILWDTTNRATDPAVPILIENLSGKPLDLSADGLIVVGPTQIGEGLFGTNIVLTPASIWSADNGTRALPFLEDHEWVVSTVVSDDGSTVAGTAQRLNGTVDRTAFIWDEEHGTQSLKIRLAMAGIDLEGWRLTSIVDISADGMTLIGFGTNPQGALTSFLVVIPEPATATLLGFGLIALGADRRRAKLRGR